MSSKPNEGWLTGRQCAELVGVHPMRWPIIAAAAQVKVRKLPGIPVRYEEAGVRAIVDSMIGVAQPPPKRPSGFKPDPKPQSQGAA